MGIVDILKNFREEFYTKSNEEIFKAINELDSKYAGYKFYDLNINGILINLGTDKKSIPLISHAIKRLNSLHPNNPSGKTLFNIGNGFLSIAEIVSNNKPEISFLIKDKNHRKARKYFNRVTSGTDLPYAATNSGNILEKFARYYEAILLYDKALKYNRNFGMALGNKAIALIYYYNIALRKNPDLLFEAKSLLKSALAKDNTLEIGGQNAIDSFKLRLASLEKYLSNKKKPSITSYPEPSPYQVFCSLKKMYLNFCFNCYKCEHGYKDNFFPPFIEEISRVSDDERLKYHSFSKKMYYSVKTLNQILEDYSTSRNIYFNATANKFSDLDKDTGYISVLDYCKNSIKYGYLKTAYIKLFNILDKIAHLTFYNYEFEHEDIYFKSLLSASFKDFIIKQKNFGLLALHDLAWDFEDGGIYNHLKIIRQYLTHEFIDIKLDMFSNSNKQLELIENRNLTETLLVDYLDELFQIVKAALLYFAQALKKEHDNATKNGRKPLLPFPIPRQKDIYEGIE